MAGIRKGSSDNLTSPIPHLLNADFLNAAARLTAGQVHYPGRDYYQRDTDTHYRLLAQAKCFLADGVTPATQAGTWGTLESHWFMVGFLAAGQARKVIKSDGTIASYQYQNSNDVIGATSFYDTYALATAASEQPFRRFGQLVKVLRDPNPGANGTYLVSSDNATLILNTATAAQIVNSFPLYGPLPATWAYPTIVQFDAKDGQGLQLYQVVSTITTPTSLPIPRSTAGITDPNWTAISATALAQTAQLTTDQLAGIKNAATPTSALNPVITKADIIAPLTSLATTSTSSTTPPSVDAVNAALALKADKSAIPTSSDNLSEGVNNLYSTPARTLNVFLAGYAKATTNTPLSSSDALLAGLGKLEKKADDNTVGLGTAPAVISITTSGIRTIGATTLQAALNQAGEGGAVVSNRTTQGNIGIGRGITVDLQGHQLDLQGTDLHMYSGARIINNGLIHNGRIFIRDGNTSGVQSIQGGSIACQIYSQGGTNPLFRLIGVQVINFGDHLANQATLSPNESSTYGNLQIELSKGASFFLCSPVSATVITTIADSSAGTTTPATATTAGVVKIGSGITVTADGTISAAASGGATTTLTLKSADGTQTGTLTVSNTGQLLYNGAAIGSSASTAPTISNATFSAS